LFYKKTILVIVLSLLISFGLFVYVNRAVITRSERLFSQVSFSTYSSILDLYRDGGFTTDEAELLVKFIGNLMIKSVYSCSDIASVVIGDLQVVEKDQFEARNVEIICNKGFVKIESIVYDGQSTVIVFSVSPSSFVGGLGQLEENRFYTLVIRDGRGVLRR